MISGRNESGERLDVAPAQALAGTNVVEMEKVPAALAGGER